MDSLSHTKWNCKYHLVFAPKYRRQAIYGKVKEDIGRMLRKLCEYKEVEILEAEACPDHIHMLVTIPPKYSVAQIVGYLKGKSSLMIFEKYANMKYKYGNRHFWCRGYYVDTLMCYTQSTISQNITKDDISCPPAGKSLHTSDKENDNKQFKRGRAGQQCKRKERTLRDFLTQDSCQFRKNILYYLSKGMQSCPRGRWCSTRNAVLPNR